MKVDLELDEVGGDAADSRRAAYRREAALWPSLLSYDYLAAPTLADDVDALLVEACRLVESTTRVALDVGSESSPYRAILAEQGWRVETMDIAPAAGVDYVGTVEATGLPDASFDIVLCTQVIEHCSEPWVALKELHRVVRPGGYLVWTVPQIWFYHPHPDDNWRFTPEGVSRLSMAGGFEVVELHLQGGPVVALLQVFNFWRFWNGWAPWRAPLFAHEPARACSRSTRAQSRALAQRCLPMPKIARAQASASAGPRILCVTHYFATNGYGIESVAAKLNEVLRARGCRVRWIASSAENRVTRSHPSGAGRDRDPVGMAFARQRISRGRSSRPGILQK